jgi:hypothetical protein
MRYAILSGSFALAFGAAIACSSNDLDTEVTDAGDASVADTGRASPPVVDSATRNRGEGPAGTGSNTGLPCDVQAVIENRCLACHDGIKAPPMLNYTDLIAKAKADPTKTVAELAVIRMTSTDPATVMPPPPAVGPEPAESTVFEDWVKAGTPRNALACTDPPPDGGAPGDGGLDGGPIPVGDAGDGGKICTSGTYWTMGNTGSPLMHPGLACNACHVVSGGPNLRIGGTDFPTVNEADDCNGKGPPPELTVIVTGADGKEFTMEVNAAGNFFLRTMQPKPPFRARVTDGTKTRAMAGSVTSGDCNSCHTATGLNGAPGRIVQPL